jgi:hypothetical protein
VEPPTTSLRECMRGFGADPSRGIRIVMQCAHETSVRALCRRPTGPLHIVALGDSVMWGQGLERVYKFASEVRRQVDIDLGPRPAPEPYIFAHSGATLGPLEPQEAWKEDLRPPQEIPLSYPTIPKQLEMAKSWLDKNNIEHDQVDLVLLNGGINDVGALQILDPSVDPDWVRERTRQKLEHMREFLPVVLDTFPKAKVVIPNYFQIISIGTSIKELATLMFVFFDLPGVAVTYALREDLALQAEVFSNEWTLRMGGIIEALRTTSPELAKRICLVDVQFSDTNAYGAEDSYLWKIVQMDGWFYTRDHVEDARRWDCDDAKNHRWWDVPWYKSIFEMNKCKLAAAFHPNVSGANRYRDAIMSGIRSRGWIEEWRGGPWTWTYEEMTASTDPPLPATQEERARTQWTGKISARELQPPHYPVRGTVVISRNNLEVKRVPTDTEFSWTFTRGIIIDKKQHLQDDRVTVHAPYARPFVLLSGETNPADL